MTSVQGSEVSRTVDTKDVRLHIGCGTQTIADWINIDVKAQPGVDLVLDVRDGLPFSDVKFVFAEHFIEHLELQEAFAFVRECRRILSRQGILRVSTPNLDWVMQSHYAYGRWLSDDDAIRDCLGTNMAFHGWGHKFIYNPSTVSALLRRAGFQEVASLAYGESDHAELRGLEKHEKSPDWPGLPHVVVVEAMGIGASSADLPEEFLHYVETCAAK